MTLRLSHHTGTTPGQANTGKGTLSLARRELVALAAAGLMALTPSAQAQTVALNQPQGVSAAVPSAKGYGQVVKLKDGTQYTFAEILEIGKKDATKEEEILAAIPDERTEDAYRKWKQGNLDSQKARLGVEETNVDKQKARLSEEASVLKKQTIKNLEDYITKAEGNPVYIDRAFITKNIIGNSLVPHLQARAQKLL